MLIELEQLNDQHREQERRSGSSSLSQQQQEGEGPEEIELLFDTQRPGMRNGRHRVPVERVVIVHEIEQAGPAEPGTPGLPPEVVDQEGAQEKDVVRRKDPEHPAQVEAPNRDIPLSMVLLEQQPGDQEAAQYDERANTEVARHC